MQLAPMTQSELAPAPPKIAVVGGGTGTSNIARGLREYAETIDITAIPSVADSGGSSQKMREMGLMPPGDTRQCLAALSQDKTLAAQFNHRYGPADGEHVAGHTYGNIWLATHERELGGFDKAVAAASNLLQICGQVIPASLDQHDVLLHDEGVMVARGEVNVRNYPLRGNSEPSISLTPTARMNEQAQVALGEADVVVIAPGNLFGSLLPVLTLRGLRETLRDSQAHVAMIGNLVNCPLQTHGWHVTDYALAIEAAIGKNRIDSIIYNDDISLIQAANKKVFKRNDPDEALTNPVATSDELFARLPRAKKIGARLAANQLRAIDANDTLIDRPRNQFLHNRRVLAKVLYGITQARQANRLTTTQIAL